MRNGRIFKSTNLWRSWALVALALGLASMAVLAACGGSGDDSTGPATATAQPGPTAEPAPAGGAGLSPPSTGSKKLFLSADSFDRILVDLAAGDMLQVDYVSEVSISPGLGGTGHQERGVLLVVLGPQEERLVTAEESADNSVSVATELSGEHQVVFINPNRLEGLSVSVEYLINP